ncbi:hypothetical protein LINPERPRIM_LOCUS33959 [Linum perenne]
MCRLKIKFGKKLRKSTFFTVSAVRLRIYKQLRLIWKRLFGRKLVVGDTTAAAVAAAGGLPAPIFISM